MTDPCQLLKWDSEFFGVRTARVNDTILDVERFQQVLAWCADHQIQFLYLLVDANHPGTVRLAEEHRFHFMDIRLTLNITDFSQVEVNDAAIRPHQPADVAALKQIARVSHRDSRFYADEHIAHELSDRLYEIWLENSCNGYAQQVLVAIDQSVPVGYITCHLDGTHGQIGLLGVSASAQSKGFGSRLIASALAWFAQKGVEDVSVVTQGRNVRAQRVYQRNGFMTESVQLWYHRWFEER
jgi:dTDP-4-amino-4,6-dideoxy-D-galactose acyltransferase